MNKEDALRDPAAVFATPEQVCRASDLTRDQKISVLRQWANDAEHLQVADEENMTGGKPSPLRQVLEALESLGAAPGDAPGAADNSEKGRGKR